VSVEVGAAKSLQARDWLSAHVDLAVCHARRLVERPAPGQIADAVAEAVADIPSSGEPSGAAREAWELWDEAGSGPGGWLDLLARSGAAEPGCRHLGTAAILQTGAAGILGAVLHDPATAPALAGRSGWPLGQVEAVLRFAVTAGWLVPATSSTVLASPQLRALAGADAVPDSWLAARFRFELDWFWAPLGCLPSALDSGQPPAGFAAPGQSGAFRAAATAMNLPALDPRLNAARRVAAALGLAEKPSARPRTILEVGTGIGAWGRVLGVAGTSLTRLDYPQVLALTAGLARDQDTELTDVGTDPVGCPPAASFDVVVANEVLHTVAPGLAAQWLRQLADRVGDDGILIIADPLLDRARREPRGHLHIQVKLALTGGGRVWDGPSLAASLRQEGLVPSRPVRVGGFDLLIARRGPIPTKGGERA